LLHGVTPIKHTDLPTIEVLSPDTGKDQTQDLIGYHGDVYVKPPFTVSVRKNGYAGLIGCAADLGGAQAQEERLYFAKRRQSRYDAGATPCGLCFALDAVIAAVQLDLQWADCKSGALTKHDLETMAATSTCAHPKLPALS
jgi:hypothetical protein